MSPHPRERRSDARRLRRTRLTAAMDVSVILPVFWRSASPKAVGELRRAVKSVIDQDYPGQMEIVVVDDGSPEPVRKALEQDLMDDRMRWVRLPRNEGLVYALNTGLLSARYDLIARIDADDAWRPGKIARQMELLRADPDLTIIGTGMRLCHNGRKPDVDLVRPGRADGILRFFATEGCPFPHGSVLARKSVYLLLGGYPHDPLFSHCEDYALWGVWLRFFKAAMVEEVLFDYTVSQSSVSAVHTAQQRRASGMVQQAWLDLGDTSRIPDAQQALAQALRVDPFLAGRSAFLLWKVRPSRVALPRLAAEPLRALLPDRTVVLSDAPADARPSPWLDLPWAGQHSAEMAYYEVT